ncbi:hypothetical protein PTKIN_Ptkin10aG0189800 [Pterospermum kingtungense]
MSNSKEQSAPNPQSHSHLEGLPLESSPYLKYQDLEDYKRKAYGTQGHLDVKENQSASGSTDAPTLSGAAKSDDNKTNILSKSNASTN